MDVLRFVLSLSSFGTDPHEFNSMEIPRPFSYILIDLEYSR